MLAASAPSVSCSRIRPRESATLDNGDFRSWLTRPAKSESRSLERASCLLRNDSSRTSTMRSARVRNASRWWSSSSRGTTSKTHKVPIVTPSNVTSL